MCANGATDVQLADEFDVSVQTLYNWRNKHPEFLEALKASKEVADSVVERSLYERATGYERDSVKIFCDKDGNVTQVPFREYTPPDTTAMIFWLKNRKPAEWKDRRQEELSGPEGGPIQSQVSIEFVNPPKVTGESGSNPIS